MSFVDQEAPEIIRLQPVKKESGNRREPRHALGESHVRSAKARQIVASLRKSCTIGKPLIHLNHVARPGFCGHKLLSIRSAPVIALMRLSPTTLTWSRRTSCRRCATARGELKSVKLSSLRTDRTDFCPHVVFRRCKFNRHSYHPPVDVIRKSPMKII